MMRWFGRAAVRAASATAAAAVPALRMALPVAVRPSRLVVGRGLPLMRRAGSTRIAPLLVPCRAAGLSAAAVPLLLRPAPMRLLRPVLLMPVAPGRALSGAAVAGAEAAA